jgi:NADPH:quinone reductase-like Zn-dependent oxidoreductase
MTEARAFWTVAPGRGEIRGETLPDQSSWPGLARRHKAGHDDGNSGAEHVLVRTLVSGVSRGTEALVFAGRVPESQRQTMRAPLMDGAFPFPVKYGYSAVGRTTEGRRVFVLHPHQDLFLAPAAMCVAVPDIVPTRRAVLAANLETALNLTWDAAPLAGERMLVIGAGVIGLLTASLLARIPAARVTVVDIDPSREGLARRFGCGFAGPHAAPAEQELIVHASSSEVAARRGVPHPASASHRHAGRRGGASDARPAQPCRAAGPGARTPG